MRRIINIYGPSFIFVIMALLLTYTITFGFLHTSEEIILIDSRQWDYFIDVGHYYTTSSYVCDDYGDIRSCKIVHDTKWSSKCTLSRSGVYLPPIRPEVMCQDEEVRENIGYWVSYHYQDDAKNRLSRIDKATWDFFKPGSILRVEVAINGRIRKIIEVLR